jgi:hypothetical protein
MYRLSVCILLCATITFAQQSAKQFKQGEFEAYSNVTKELSANRFQAAVNAIDDWKQKYRDSDYRNEREALAVQAYAGVNLPVKALDAAAPLIASDLKTIFPGPEGQAVVLRLLYSAAWAISRIPNPAPDELKAGEKAARELLDWDQPLPGVPAAKWAEARADMKDKANAALLYIAMLPGMQAMAKKPQDCAAAEAAYSKALNEFPDKSILSYELARALTCEAKEKPDKASLAIYEFERAAAIDPTLGGARRDAKQVQQFADSAYMKFHGSDEGLAQIKDLAKRAPFPPEGFVIKSSAAIAEEKQAVFDAANPQIALWAKIRAALLQPDGEQYFESGLKGAAVPQLSGRLVEAKPSCNPRELMVAVPTPDAPDVSRAEVDVKLASPLRGKPEIGQNIRWQGVPVAVSKEPLLLTVTADASGVEGVKLTPCSAGRARGGRANTGGR